MKKISKKISGKQVEIALIFIVLVLAIYIVYRFANKEKFLTTTSTLPTLRVYKADWCGHSEKLLETDGVWDEIKKDTAVNTRINFETVDCDSQSQTCTDAGINGLPTIKLDDAVYDKRPPNLETLKKFILDNIKKPTTSTS
jgi:hypothetical protein